MFQRHSQTVRDFARELALIERDLTFSYTEEQRNQHLETKLIQSVYEEALKREDRPMEYRALVDYLQSIEEGIPERSASLGLPARSQWGGCNESASGDVSGIRKRPHPSIYDGGACSRGVSPRIEDTRYSKLAKTGGEHIHSSRATMIESGLREHPRQIKPDPDPLPSNAAIFAPVQQQLPVAQASAAPPYFNGHFDEGRAARLQHFRDILEQKRAPRPNSG